MNPRLTKLFKSFPSEGLDGLFVSSWPNGTYLSGFKGTESWLLVSPKGLYFITDSRYAEQASAEAKGFRLVLRDKQSVAQIVAGLVRRLGIRTLGFESMIVTHSFYEALRREIPAHRLKPSRNLVENLRLVKEPSEIRSLRKSAGIAVQGYHYIRQAVRPGMTEREVQGRLEYFTKSIGSERPAFEIIIAAGPRSSMPHCQSNETVIKKNDLVLVDMGVVAESYHSDLTRPIFLGKMTILQKKITQIVWNAQRAGIRKAKPGVSCREVDQVCRRLIEKQGYGRYFGHGTGHGVGLEIHESPTVSSRSDTVLKPGMVITVEPGIYLPGKFGIRIEDMVLITQNGNEVLTRDLDQ